MFFIYRNFLITLLAMATALPVGAKAKDRDQDAGSTKDIVVDGEALPPTAGAAAYGVATIDRERLTHSASGRLEDVLRDVAGLQQFRRSDSRSANPTAQGVTLRAIGGNATSRALVLLDGVPQADPFFGYIPFNAIAPDRLKAVRVTRGGGTGPFGAGAVAGTIELISAGRDSLPLYEADGFYGSRDSQMLSASVSPDVGVGFVSFSGQFDRSDGFYTTPQDQRDPATARARYRNWSTSLRMAAPIDADTEVQARGVVYRDDRTLRFTGADSSTEANDASVRLIHRGPWQVDALAYVQARNFSNRVISSSSHQLVLDQRNTPSTGLGGKIEVRPPVGDGHLLRIGVDTRLADGALYEDPYSGGAATAHRHAGGQTQTLGLFVEDDWTLGPLVLTGGGRIDRWTITGGFYRELSADGVLTRNDRYADRDGVEATGRVGALFHAGEHLALRAAAYTGFRLPTLNELYRPYVVYPVVTEANAALDPERMKGAEAGFDLTPAEGVSLGVTAFYNRLDGAIANVTIGPDLRQRRNVDAIEAKGVEVNARAERGAFALSASYAYNDSKVVGSGASAALDGREPAQSPRHSASTTLAWAPRSGALLSTTLRYTGRQYEDDLETDSLPDAFTVDAVAELPLGKGVSLVGRAENLFDETVVTRSDAGSLDLGTPRTLWIGLRIG
ncbi:TonB-dependent receptor plug domain-containing protein [Stakelama saccharophila]|uniref:TonB-dependent receptor n=1 Tax=Stakelama saccharophila TaxID=3075605 RepID=A0ABZ0B5Q7_9SPHN|nr:TonB-dependent receptor [Stakelama sp. W311]WNO52709.1 TonB-dependent receptor [Stakelama sp. W311]